MTTYVHMYIIPAGFFICCGYMIFGSQQATCLGAPDAFGTYYA